MRGAPAARAASPQPQGGRGPPLRREPHVPQPRPPPRRGGGAERVPSTRRRAAAGGFAQAHSSLPPGGRRLRTQRGRGLTLSACRPPRGLVGRARWRPWLAALGLPAASFCEGQVSVTAAQGLVPGRRFSPRGARLPLSSLPEPARCCGSRQPAGLPSLTAGPRSRAG